jgi:ribosomal protein S18 acetylase RimI-like enzyme
MAAGAVRESQVEEIEGAALRAWPAAEVRELGGWRLRFMSGVTNRGNSVWIGREAEGGRDLLSRIREAEAFYRARGVAPMFQVTPLAPEELDPVLAERGYRAHTRTSVHAAGTARVASLPLPEGVSAWCEPALDPAWFEVSGHRGRFQGEAVAVYAGLLARLGDRAGFARARTADGEIAAVGLGFCAPPLAGISSMLTLPAQRGRRLGLAVLVALARWAGERGAARLYLQVEDQNASALALYARAGFTRLYGYHYRRLD